MRTQTPIVRWKNGHLESIYQFLPILTMNFRSGNPLRRGLVYRETVKRHRSSRHEVAGGVARVSRYSPSKSSQQSKTWTFDAQARGSDPPHSSGHYI
jgi:hypothetical protein